MPRIASPLRKRSRIPRDAGFTITELIAGLLVASLLMAGMVDIIRRYARTTEHVRGTTNELRTTILTDALFKEIERADPETLSLSRLQIRAKLGGEPIDGQIADSGKATTLRWSSPMGSRSIALPLGAHFVSLSSGAVAIVGEEDKPPVAIAIPRRTLPFDCQFDTVSRECRK